MEQFHVLHVPISKFLANTLSIAQQKKRQKLKCQTRKENQTTTCLLATREKKLKTTTSKEGGEAEQEEEGGEVDETEPVHLSVSAPTRRTSRQREMVDSEDNLADDGDDTDDTPRRTSRTRKVSVRVQRALQEEKDRKEKKMSRAKKPAVIQTPTVTADDPLLEAEKIHLQRYNPQTNEMEYLTQHKGFELHRSIWLSRTALTGSEKLITAFQTYWNDIKSKASTSNAFSVGQNLWVKLRGHAWWPARVVQCTNVGNNQNDYIVTFYGDNTFGFVNDYTPQDFVLESFEDSDKHKKSNNLKAVQQAVNLVPEEPKEDSEMSAEGEANEDEQLGDHNNIGS